jgi:hypothetical protein
MHLLRSIAIRPNLEWKTRSKQLLGFLLLDIALHAHFNVVLCYSQVIAIMSILRVTKLYFTAYIKYDRALMWFLTIQTGCLSEKTTQST